MTITTSELKNNLEKFLELSETEDVLITTDHGGLIAKLTNADAERIAIAESLYGVISPDITLEEAREERLSRI